MHVLRLHLPNVGSIDLIPNQGAKIQEALGQTTRTETIAAILNKLSRLLKWFTLKKIIKKRKILFLPPLVKVTGMAENPMCHMRL